MSKTFHSLIALSLFGLATTANAARNDDRCAPEPAALCNEDECVRCHCLGPDNYAVNAPVRPLTCDGDLFIEVSAFYWRAYEDGLEYAVKNEVASSAPNQRLHKLVDSNFEGPDFDWEFGFKLAFGYNSPCDGWDIGIYWTQYRPGASTHVEAEEDDNQILLPIWSSLFGSIDEGDPLTATDIKTHWKFDLNLIDIELGREFWVSKYVTLRPHIGIRIGYLDQSYEINYSGGSWNDLTNPANGTVDLDNDFKGAGIRTGFDTVWNLGCGWALYGNLAFSLINGRFDIDQDEYVRDVNTPFHKRNMLKTENSFRSTKMIADLGLGIQWSTLFCDCKYGFNIALGYEQHLFFDQNQLWRIVIQQGSSSTDRNNIYHQGRGDLSTQGWTLTVGFQF